MSFAGLLSYCSSIIKGGRTFSRRVIDQCNSLEKPHHQTRLSKQFYMDLDDFWIPYSITFNGRAKLIDSRPMPLTSFQCDACLKGYGVYFQGDWRAGSWNSCVKPVPQEITLLDSWQDERVPDEIIDNINYLELYTVLVAARCFGTKWRNLHVVVYTDNTQAMALINKGVSKNSLVMSWLRELFWLSVVHNCHITSHHIKGKHNWIADKLSRLHDSHKWEQVIPMLQGTHV